MADETTKERLEYLRSQIHAECISQGELIELQGLAEFIDPGDVELLEWAGVPEFPKWKVTVVRRTYGVAEVEADTAEHAREDIDYDEVIWDDDKALCEYDVHDVGPAW